jgi:hypothetical protein
MAVSKECRDEKSSERDLGSFLQLEFVFDHEPATIIQKPPEALAIRMDHA